MSEFTYWQRKNTKKYEDGYDRIFGRKQEITEQEIIKNKTISIKEFLKNKKEKEND